jgi:fucose permease
VSFVLQAPAGPFPLLIVSYLIDGAGMSLQQAQANTYVGSLDDRSKMGILHACYGLGALCAPLLATWFAPQRHWSFHYIVSSGLGVTNMIVLLAVFRMRTLNGEYS